MQQAWWFLLLVAIVLTVIQLWLSFTQRRLGASTTHPVMGALVASSVAAQAFAQLTGLETTLGRIALGVTLVLLAVAGLRLAPIVRAYRTLLRQPSDPTESS